MPRTSWCKGIKKWKSIVDNNKKLKKKIQALQKFGVSTKASKTNKGEKFDSDDQKNIHRKFQKVGRRI